MDLSLIIPAYNEASRIERSLQAGLDYFADAVYSWEIVVVDDGSSDDTVKRVAAFEGAGVRLISLGKNRGKGAAVRRGMLEASGQKRIFTDADFSTPIDEVTPMLEHLEKYDIAIGSRAVDRSRVEVHQPWYRETMGKIFNLFVQRIAVSGIKDTQCGFKGFRGAAAEEVFSRSKIVGFSFDVEALYIARRLGYSILEFPVRWINDERSTVNPITDSIRMFGELMRIRRLHSGLEIQKGRSSVPKK
jgi:dolichyl-phosphate beta-glucosyltransferase